MLVPVKIDYRSADGRDDAPRGPGQDEELYRALVVQEYSRHNLAPDYLKPPLPGLQLRGYQRVPRRPSAQNSARYSLAMNQSGGRGPRPGAYGYTRTGSGDGPPRARSRVLPHPATILTCSQRLQRLSHG